MIGYGHGGAGETGSSEIRCYKLSFPNVIINIYDELVVRINGKITVVDNKTPRLSISGR